MNQTKPTLSIWQSLLLISTGGICTAVLLIIFGIWRTSDRFLDILQGFLQPQPVLPQAELSSAIVEKVKSVRELTTTVYTMETIIPASADRKLGDFSLATTKLLYLAHGEVKAGIDLTTVTIDNITITDDRIDLSLPSPQILDSKIDINRSRVYDYDRGFLNLGPDVAPQLQTLAQRETIEHIENSACRDGILNTANQKAATVISQLLTIATEIDISVRTTPTSVESCLASLNEK